MFKSVTSTESDTAQVGLSASPKPDPARQRPPLHPLDQEMADAFFRRVMGLEA